MRPRLSQEQSATGRTPSLRASPTAKRPRHLRRHVVQVSAASGRVPFPEEHSPLIGHSIDLTSYFHQRIILEVYFQIYRSGQIIRRRIHTLA